MEEIPPTPFPATTTSTTSTTSSTTTLALCPIVKLRNRLTDGLGYVSKIYEAGSTAAPQCVADKIEQTIKYCRDYLTPERLNVYRSSYMSVARSYCYNACQSLSTAFEVNYCLTYWYQAECVDFYASSYYLRQVLSGGLLDDCVSDVLFNTMPKHYTQGGAIDWQISSWASYALRRNRVCEARLATGTKCHYADASLFLDTDCNPISTSSEQLTACDIGRINANYCPISLALNPKADLNKDIAISSFPLDPRTNSNWYIWKASKEFPLLVYDPEHKGKINSVFNLFGHWTFGGKRSALGSLWSSDSKNNLLPWNDGFEALGSLDENHDGQLNGEELKDLALWFDEGRDGVASAGEVKSLKEAGINRLFYSPNREDTGTGDLIADRGFERIVDGKLQVGQAIDWKAYSAQSKEGIIKKHLNATINGSDCLLDSSENSQQPKKEVRRKISSVAQLPNLKSNKTAELYGFWKWTVSDSTEKSGKLGGYLSFKENVDGTLSGHSYSSFVADDVNQKGRVIFSSRELSGKKRILPSGNIELNFKILTAEGNVLETQAILNKTKDILSGSTVAKVTFGMTAVDMSYKWTAKRFRP